MMLLVLHELMGTKRLPRHHVLIRLLLGIEQSKYDASLLMVIDYFMRPQFSIMRFKSTLPAVFITTQGKKEVDVPSTLKAPQDAFIL